MTVDLALELERNTSGISEKHGSETVFVSKIGKIYQHVDDIIDWEASKHFNDDI